MKPKSEISVIVPVYNVESYLDRCIKSILSQTFIDYELILVDDGSSDKSGTICDLYAMKDDRIKVIHQTNGGVSRARNVGINAAIGTWICFIDSDDRVGPDLLSSLYEARQDTDLIISGMFRLNAASEIISTKTFTNALICVDEMVKSEFENSIFRSKGPYCKLYKSKIIKKNSILFPEGIHASEDFIFNLRYLSFCKKIKTIDYVGYYYENHGGGLVTKKWPFEQEVNLVDYIGAIMVRLESSLDKACLETIEKYRSELLYRALISIYHFKYSFKQRMDYLHFLYDYPFRYGVTFKKIYFPHNWKVSACHLLFRLKFFLLFDVIMKRI